MNSWVYVQGGGGSANGILEVYAMEGGVEVDRRVMLKGCVVEERSGSSFLGLSLPLLIISETQKYGIDISH